MLKMGHVVHLPWEAPREANQAFSDSHLGH